METRTGSQTPFGSKLGWRLQWHALLLGRRQVVPETNVYLCIFRRYTFSEHSNILDSFSLFFLGIFDFPLFWRWNRFRVHFSIDGASFSWLWKEKQAWICRVSCSTGINNFRWACLKLNILFSTKIIYSFFLNNWVILILVQLLICNKLVN